MWKYDNKYIKFVQCCYSGFFCDILSLSVKIYLWLKLYTVPFFVSGQTYKISKGSNHYCSHCIYILPGQKKVAHTNILLDRLLFWLQSAFAVALFWHPYSMSQLLFPSRVVFLFGQDFVLVTGESNHSFLLFQLIPKTFNWVKVGTLWWPICVWKWLLMLTDTHVS